MVQSPGQDVVPITHLRNRLDIACQHVAIADEPIIVQRYKRQDGIVVPLRESTFLGQIEVTVRAGQTPSEDDTDGGG